MPDAESITTLAAALVADLIGAGRTVATAESCTGGWIAKALTDVSGSSAAFGYGVVSYSNAAKASLLGVAESTLQAHGAVQVLVQNHVAQLFGFFQAILIVGGHLNGDLVD